MSRSSAGLRSARRGDAGGGDVGRVDEFVGRVGVFGADGTGSDEDAVRSTVAALLLRMPPSG